MYFNLIINLNEYNYHKTHTQSVQKHGKYLTFTFVVAGNASGHETGMQIM